MRFYGNGVVWDAVNNRRLCKFSRATELHGKGVLETDDTELIARLSAMGIQHDEMVDVETETLTVHPVSADMKPAELREIGKELGLSFPVGTTKADMAKAINEAKK